MMWLYDITTRRFAGAANSEIPDGHAVTTIQPPTLIVGQTCLLGTDDVWYIRDIQPIFRARGRLALHRAGLLQAAEAIIAQSDIETRIWYEEQVWERSDPVVVQMGAALGLTPEQIDAMFLAA